MKRTGPTIFLILATHSFVLGAQLGAPAQPKSSAPTAERQARLARAQQLAKTMEELFKLKKFEKAIPVAEELVASSRELFGERNAETAFAIHQLGFFRFSTGSLAEAKKLNEQALAIRREVLGNKHPHVALSLHNLGDTLAGLGNYDEALVCQHEALEIFRKTIGENSPEVARLLHSIAITEVKNKDNTAAQTHFEQALAIRRQALGDKHPDTAQTLVALATSLVSTGSYVDARQYLEEALVIYRATLGEKHPATVGTLVSLAATYSYLHDLDAQQSYYEQALAIRRDTLGDDHPDTLDILSRLGVVLASEGNIPAAIRVYQQELASYQRAGRQDTPETVPLILRLGTLHGGMAEHAISRSYFEKALAITSKASGEQDPATLQARIPLAACLGALGDRQAALAQFQQALAIQNRSLPEMHFDSAFLFNEMGWFLRDLGRYKEARKYLSRALAIRMEILGPTHPRTVNTLESLSIACLRQRDFVAARSYCDQVLAVRQQILPDQHPDLARALDTLGFVTACAGEPSEAISYLTKSVEMSRGTLGDSHPATADALNSLTEVTAALGDFTAAAGFADQSRRAVRRHVASELRPLPERDQLSYLVIRDEIALHRALSVGVRGGKDPKIAALSAGWLLNSKGLTQEVLAERTVLARESRDPQVREIAERLLAVRAQQARLVLAVPSRSRVQLPFEERAKLARDEESLSRQLAQAGDHEMRPDPWVELDEVRQKLSQREVLVDTSRFRLRSFDLKTLNEGTGTDHYVAWIIPPIAKGDVKIVDLGEAMAIDRAVLALRVAIKSVYTLDEATGRVKSIDARALKLFNAAFLDLSQLILHPLVQQIGQATELIVSPDAGLWLVPWNALLLSDGRFAVEQYQIRYLVSCRELVAPPSSHAPGRPMIVASPDFDLDPATARQITQAVLGGGKLSGGQGTPAALRRPAAHPIATPLPGFDKQAELVMPNLAKFSGKKPGVFTGQNALEGLVKSVHSPRVLLFATHGFFEPALAMSPDERKALETWVAMSGGAPPPVTRPPDNPLLHCGVLLAGCNHRDHSEAEDGVLTGMEIVGMDLRGTELVVLSACDTGVGEVRVGEGVAGVRQAFQLAGAEAVVATLWPVMDRESTLEMSDFFSNLAAGKSKAESLRGAQLAAINRLKKQYGVAPPLQWAAFTITGK